MSGAGENGGALLDLEGVTKRFGEVTANDGVSLAIRRGEVHALLGENGAGKSTLVKIIYGVLEPDAGTLAWKGTVRAIRSPAEARALGIGMVFQHFSVFDALSVAENIALALPREPMRQLSARIGEVSGAYGLAIDPGRAVHTLSVGEKQRVEIIRCLLQDPSLMIMDEPTSVLTPQEAELLFEVLRRLAAEGCAILYISHRLEEVAALCETATVLRQGRVVATCDPRAETPASMAAMMVGSDVDAVEKPPSGGTLGAPRLVLDRLDLPAASEFAIPLREVSLEVRGGEIVGIAGVAGEGQSELMDALTGERRAPRADAVTMEGQPVGRLGPTRRRRIGAAFVPEERNGHAAIGEMALSENLILTRHAVAGLTRGVFVDRGKARAQSAELRQRFDVRAPAGDPAASALSGGNLQKFVVGREIARDPGVLVVSQPTWGVDPGAAAVIRNALIDLAAAGAAVLIISQDLEEIFAICDRIAVIHRGKLSHAFPAAEMSAEKVGLLMGGAHPESTELDGSVLDGAPA